MTVIVTRNVSDKIRGYLASCMLQVAPGVYSAPRMTTGVRERVVDVLEEWFPKECEASIVVIWADNQVPEGQGMRLFGHPPYEIFEYDGVLLSKLSKSL